MKILHNQLENADFFWVNILLESAKDVYNFRYHFDKRRALYELQKWNQSIVSIGYFVEENDEDDNLIMIIDVNCRHEINGNELLLKLEEMLSFEIYLTVK